eukprot:5265055-Pyramimonas_sp.AAC.1
MHTEKRMRMRRRRRERRKRRRRMTNIAKRTVRNITATYNNDATNTITTHGSTIACNENTSDESTCKNNHPTTNIMSLTTNINNIATT